MYFLTVPHTVYRSVWGMAQFPGFKLTAGKPGQGASPMLWALKATSLGKATVKRKL